MKWIPLLIFLLMPVGSDDCWVEKVTFRKPTSINVGQYGGLEREYLRQDVQEKLLRLHVYYVMEQKISHYDGSVYQSLAIESSSDLIEQDFKKMLSELSAHHSSALSTRLSVLNLEIKSFSERSELASFSMAKLKASLGQSSPKGINAPGTQALEREYLELSRSSSFSVYKNNIEHLAQVLRVRQGKMVSKQLKQQLLTKNSISCTVKACQPN